MKRTLSLIVALILALGLAAHCEQDALKAETEALRARVAELEAQNVELAARAAELEDKCAELDAQASELTYQNEYLKSQLDAYADPSVIVAFTGGRVTFEEVYAAYEEVKAYYSEIYEAFGYEYEENPEEALQIQIQLATDLANAKILDLYIEEGGYVLVSDEETLRIKAEAQAEFDELYAGALEYFTSEGSSESQAMLMADEYLKENELTLEDLTNQALNQARSTALTDLLVGEFEVSQEEIQAAYDELAASDMEYYGEYPEEYAFDSLYTDSAIAYVPEGYRRVRMVVVPFSPEDMEAFDELYMREAADGPEADALYEKLLPEADALYEKLCAGLSFDEARAQYPDTESYMEKLGADGGFSISAGSTIFDEDTTIEIMRLDAPGKVTEPMRNDWGYAIFEYAGDVSAGYVPLSQIEAEVRAIAENNKRGALYEEALEDLRQKAGVICFFERLN